ncbi:lycopene cyclase family protein [Nocardiopsis salina]|uniref:lycopene cyclase family protein n=1 Tax=Nocardiopsis salina TaxID=245836 RepID=UPI00034DCFB8|nr:lycopene cyclase family protein [Nocardiopsis salina]
MPDYDFLIVGGGAAGLSLAHHLTGVNARRSQPLRAALLEPPPGASTPVPRTWCFWEPEGGRWDALLTASWKDLAVIGADGEVHRSSASPFVYKMLRSTDVEHHVRTHADDHLDQLTQRVIAVSDGPDHATVVARTPDGREVRHTARWVFDSRPAPPTTRGHTHLLQHFRGRFVRAAPGSFDPAAAVLMDLRPTQPDTGVAFSYVLPLTEREALVEYTEFGRQALTTPQYETALTDYCALAGINGVEVVASEQGVIPMTDGRFTTRTGRRLFRVGTAGGATRPSTGYTFSGVSRQIAAVADALAHDRVPVPPVPHRARHLTMDAIMLRALDRGRVSGADFFTGLFADNRLGNVLAFLDGRSAVPREIAIGLSTPVAAMSRATIEHAWSRCTETGRSLLYRNPRRNS